jgi:hypothetical protein
MAYELLVQGVDPAIQEGFIVAVPPPGTSSYQSLVLRPMEDNRVIVPDTVSPEAEQGRVVDETA